MGMKIHCSHEKTPCSFKISPGLYVEFPGTDVTRRGRVLQASDGSIKIIDEKDGRVVSYPSSSMLPVNS